MTITEAITVPSGVDIEGAQAGVDASTGSRAVDADPADETIFSESVTLQGKARLDGVTLKARPTFTNVDDVSIVNTRLVGIDVATTGDHLARAVVGLNQWDDVVTLNIDGCYFGDNAGVYNLFECNAQLGDGTSISNNYFTAASCSHNQINVYDVENGATITIKDNTFEKSANAVRVGTKGDKDVNIILDGNGYDATDTDPDWAGLVLIQPYGKATTSMKDVVIRINNTINGTTLPQLFYMYEGANDAKLAGADLPTIYVDNVQMDWDNLGDKGKLIVA